MSDRIKGLIVTLEADMRAEDAENIINAIRHIRGVADVSSVLTNSEDFINRQMIRSEIKKGFWNFYDSI